MYTVHCTVILVLLCLLGWQVVSCVCKLRFTSAPGQWFIYKERKNLFYLSFYGYNRKLILI